MFRTAFKSALQVTSAAPLMRVNPATTATQFTTPVAFRSMSSFSPPEIDLDNAPFTHFRPRNGPNPKFKSPRKRASSLFHELNVEACDQSKTKRPAVFEPRVEPGDAIELHMITRGGPNTTNSSDIEKIRGVVIGKKNRGLGSNYHVLDVMHGEPVERKVPLHSPLLKSVQILEKNFVYKGRRRVKRAKLYFLRHRNPTEFRVTKW